MKIKELNFRLLNNISGFLTSNDWLSLILTCKRFHKTILTIGHVKIKKGVLFPTRKYKIFSCI